MATTSPKVVFLREGGLAASIISDSYTFGLLVGSVWFNHEFIGGSYFLNAVILMMLIFFVASKGTAKTKTFHNLEDLRAYLDEETSR